MKLSEYQGEDAIEMLGEIIEPAATILADKTILGMIQSGGRKIDGIKYALKTYNHEIVQILAAVDGVPAEEYKCNVFTLPVKIVELLNDEELKDFFESQFQNMESGLSGTATEVTQATAEK